MIASGALQGNREEIDSIRREVASAFEVAARNIIEQKKLHVGKLDKELDECLAAATVCLHANNKLCDFATRFIEMSRGLATVENCDHQGLVTASFEEVYGKRLDSLPRKKVKQLRKEWQAVRRGLQREGKETEKLAKEHRKLIEQMERESLQLAEINVKRTLALLKGSAYDLKKSLLSERSSLPRSLVWPFARLTWTIYGFFAGDMGVYLKYAKEVAPILLDIAKKIRLTRMYPAIPQGPHVELRAYIEKLDSYFTLLGNHAIRTLMILYWWEARDARMLEASESTARMQQEATKVDLNKFSERALAQFNALMQQAAEGIQ